MRCGQEGKVPGAPCEIVNKAIHGGRAAALGWGSVRFSSSGWKRSLAGFGIGIPLLLLGLMVILGGGLAFAQAKKDPRVDLTEMSLEDLMKIEVDTVYGASKYQQKVTEAPASVSIVTSDEIQKYGYRTLAEVLRSVRGFYVSNDRNYSYVGVRGFARPGDYNSRILLLVDGHRLNDAIYDGALIGTEFPIDIDLIERVEIIRGPSSSLYGTSAFFGVVNVVTKRGKDLNAPVVSTEIGSHGSYKGRVSYGERFKNGLEMLFSSSYFNSHGPSRLFFKEFDSPSTNNGIAQDVDSDQSKSFFTNLSFGDFRFQGVYGTREKGIPTGSFGTVFNDPRTRTTDAWGYLDLQYEHTFVHQWELMARLSYDHYSYDGTYIYDYAGTGAPPFVENMDLGRAQWWGFEVNMSKTYQEKHRITVGSEIRDNVQQDQSNFDLQPFLQYLDDRRASKNWAVYFQDEFKIRKDLILNAGLRYDRYDTFGGQLNPRLALIYNPLKKTTVKLLFGRAFRAPNFYELFYESSPDTKGNPFLKPETISTTELVLEQYLNKNFRFAASGFYNRIGGLINQETDPVDGLIQYRNLDRVHAKGLEFELEGRWSNGLQGRVGYTLQNSESQREGETLSNSPKHLGKANLIVPLVSKKLFAGIEGQYASRRRSVQGSDIGGFFVTNVNLLSQKLAKGFDVSLGVYNVFDKRYADPGAEEHIQQAIEQDGRNFRLKLTYRF